MNQQLERVIPRHAQRTVDEALADTRIVLVNGARQAGKHTVAELAAAARPGSQLRSLDSPDWLSAAADDPIGFLRHDGLLVVDEIQRAPELFLPLKHSVDFDRRPGRFLLTGSARILGLKQLPDALPGRMETVELWPLSQGEIEGGADRFAESIFELGEGSLPQLTPVDRREAAARIVRGGYPEAVLRNDERRRRRLLAGYIQDVLERDVREIAEIERLESLRQLLSLTASRSGQLLVTQQLSRALKLPSTTVARYLGVLEEIFLLKRIPAWSSNLGKRVVATPKAALTDSGVAAYLLGQNVERLTKPVNNAIGPLLEGFVVMELARQLTWAEDDIRLFHFRTKDQQEVDAVLETNDGRVAGVEVKASATVTSKDFAGLRQLERQAGDQFRCGVVLHLGESSLSFGPRLKALPLSALWEL